MTVGMLLTEQETDLHADFPTPLTRVSDLVDWAVSMGCSDVFGEIFRLCLDLLRFIQVIPNETICEKCE